MAQLPHFTVVAEAASTAVVEDMAEAAVAGN
jgi:hypothetical protein